MCETRDNNKFMIDKCYDPQSQENKVYSLWEKAKVYKAKAEVGKKPFCIIMPPPNANAPLHIGHAMFVTLEDIMTRYQRMQGKEVLWLPGADHAGILTQVVFEKVLADQGKTRSDLGREKFYKACLAFTQKNKKLMFSQIKKLGACPDWSREKFTLDKKISEIVLETFAKLYKEGLAYRGKRIINWCPRCATALSNLEVDYKQEKGKLYFLKYPLKDKSKITGFTNFLVVATTRPETMLGDTAVAIHPQDGRYKKFIDKTVILPIVGREIPVIADGQVNPDFGTGVVKVTPAHDPDDWQMGKRHKLTAISVIGFDNKMTKEAGKEFAGLSAQKAREKILRLLKDQNLLLKEKNYLHTIGVCERCQMKIEPQVSLQWFIDTSSKFKVQSSKLSKLLGVKKASLGEIGILAVKKGLIKIIPRRFEKTYFDWMNNIQDWCVSRQLWWGHRMPIWYCGLKGLSELQKEMNPDLVAKNTSEVEESRLKVGRDTSEVNEGCGQTIVSLKKPKKCPQCGSTNIIQDPDTFDTWFSSSQWPYTTLGFDASRKKSKVKSQKSKVTDFNYWYPTSVMETGYEILFFWVARMIMLGLYRTGQVPFKTVYLHGLVRDAFGQKMSKSKGNVIDPTRVIEKYGADSLRLALITGTAAGNDVSVSENKIKGYRNFCNKLWNIGRFINLQFNEFAKSTWPGAFGHLRGDALSEAQNTSEVTPANSRGLLGRWKNKVNQIPFYQPDLPGITLEDKAIIKKLEVLAKKTTQDLENYHFSQAAQRLYQFVWHELADSYVESTKERLRNDVLPRPRRVCPSFVARRLADQQNKKTAPFSVLLHVYLNCLKLLHPFAPFVTEALWQKMPKKDSLLLIKASWPKTE